MKKNIVTAIAVFAIFALFFTSCGTVGKTAVWIYNESDRMIAVVDKNGKYSFEDRHRRYENAPKGGIMLINSNAKNIYMEIKISDFEMKKKAGEAYTLLVPRLPVGVRITVVSITASNTVMGDFLIDELTSLLVNENKYIVVDRRSLDSVRYEQYFQMSGDVDDNTAVSIGKLLGANLIITGELKDDNTLVLKAHDVETARIFAVITI